MILGASLVMAAAVAAGMGIILQKRGIGDHIESTIHSPLWLTGIGLDLTGFGLYFLALHVDRISIIQPLMTSSLLVVALAELFLFEEKPAIRDIVAIFLFMIGIAMVALG